jgi:hypothetical protein
MKRAILTRILLLSVILGTTCLMASNAQAMGSDTSLNLQYEVLEGETLYAVATANGDLRFFNQGPGAVRIRWYDSLSGKKDQQDLGPGKSLLTYGSLGAQVSEGTIVLIEQVGPDALSRGIASLPTAPSMHDSVHCFSNGAFLPWHRGLYLGSDGQMQSPPKDGILMVVADEPRDFTPADHAEQGRTAIAFIMSLEHGPGLHDSIHCLVGGTMCSAWVLEDAILSVIWGQTIAKSLEHGPGLHDSIHCIVGGTMCSARSSNDPVFIH